MNSSSGRDVVKPGENQAESAIIAAVRTILQNLGDDPHREGLVKTPERVARALLFLTCGCDLSLEDAINDAAFYQNNNEMVLVRDIEVSSLCEHHLMPFFGKVHIAYKPQDRVLGLSKLVRIANIYARRMPIQERLTQQVARGIHDASEATGVVVVMECSHMCMSLRGVCQTSAVTVTRSYTGVFQSGHRLREEFHALPNKPQ